MPSSSQPPSTRSDEALTADVVVIGAGDLGCAIAARLSRTTASVVVLEARGDVGEEASKGNAGVAPSYYAAPGTMEARLIADSYRRWPEITRKLDVTYRQLGGIITALDDEQAYGTFNMGAGFLFVVPASQAAKAIETVSLAGRTAWHVGTVIEGEGVTYKGQVQYA